jgi:molybdenum cofactor biosynthesis protein B
MGALVRCVAHTPDSAEVGANIDYITRFPGRRWACARARMQAVQPRQGHNRAVSAGEHKAQAPPSVGCFVITVSDTRTEANDTSGRAIRDLLQAAGHAVTGHAIVRDEPSQVAALVKSRLDDAATQVIITTGGTGISARDATFEAVNALFEKRLDGFGELFRMLSFQDIGSSAMMSRATAGTIGQRALFVLPGSLAAVRLAMEKLIVPELGHIVQQLRK